MSNREGSPGGPEPSPGDDLGRLAAAVERAVGRIEELEGELAAVQARGAELERLLASFQAGDEKPAEMKARLDRLETVNADMRDRLERGRAGVERLLARIKFLEEQR